MVTGEPPVSSYLISYENAIHGIILGTEYKSMQTCAILSNLNLGLGVLIFSNVSKS